MKIDKPQENWTKFPNSILDNLELFTPAELKVLCLMVRKNLGYQNPNKLFALTYIRDKTGMAKQTVIKAVSGLCEKGSIVEIPSRSLTKKYEIVWKTPEVQKIDRSNNHTGSGLKTLPVLVQKLDSLKENTIKKTLKENNGFKKPTIEEIQEYCKERKNNIDPEYFYHYYEARDWKLSNNRKIKSWKSCIITFEKNQSRFKPKEEMTGEEKLAWG